MLNSHTEVLKNIKRFGSIENYIKAINLEDVVYRQYGTHIEINNKSTLSALMATMNKKLLEKNK